MTGLARVSPTLIRDYSIPAPCGFRLYLRQAGFPEGEPDPFLATLALLGERHESRQRERLAPYVDLAVGSPEERIARTRAALESGARRPLYRPLLLAVAELAGRQREIVGEPDFLLPRGDGWSVLEIKLARRVGGRYHPEIQHQVSLYGWLLERTTGRAPASLEVLLGDGGTAELPYDGAVEARELLGRLIRIREGTSYGYEPVGWSKCMPCAYHYHCWKEARARDDVSLVADLDQGLARELHRRGVRTFHDLVEGFDEDRLSALGRPWGNGSQRVGSRAGRLLLHARAMASGKKLRLRALEVPDAAHFAVFDIEGIPPDYEDDLGRIFLWGLKVFGERPSGFRYAAAGFDVEGDRGAWFEFLALARDLHREYGPGLPFVHWSPYEAIKMRSYLKRYGDDTEGTARRVQGALFDLLECTRRTWVLPLPSYSLKVVEGYAGYRRRLPEANGAWAMAKYIEAVEKGDTDQRAALMEEIRRYNEEDLDATRRVLVWLLEEEGRPVRESPLPVPPA